MIQCMLHILLVYLGFILYSRLKVTAPNTDWIELQKKMRQLFFRPRFSRVDMCVGIMRCPGTAWCVGPCDFSLGVKDVTLAIAVPMLLRYSQRASLQALHNLQHVQADLLQCLVLFFSWPGCSNSFFFSLLSPKNQKEQVAPEYASQREWVWGLAFSLSNHVCTNPWSHPSQYSSIVHPARHTHPPGRAQCH